MPIHVVNRSDPDTIAAAQAGFHDVINESAENRARSQAASQDGGGARTQDSLSSAAGSLSVSASLFSSGMGWAAVDCAIAMTVATVVSLSSLSNAGASKPFQLPHVHAHLWITGLPFAIFVMICSRLAGLHKLKEDRSETAQLSLIIQSVILAAFALLGFQTLCARSVTTAAALAVECLAISAAMYLIRSMSSWYRRDAKQRGLMGRRILIVGADSVGCEIRAYLTALKSAHYTFKGFVSMCEPHVGDSPEAQEDIVGDIHDAIALARSLFVEELIFSRRPSTSGILSHILQQAKAVGIDVRLIPSLSETLINRPDVQFIENLPTIAILQNRRRTVSRVIKRGIDIIGALVASLMASPLFIAIAIAVKVSSPGPIFYVSKRVGYKGTLFPCYKFRTMVVGAASMQANLAHLNERTDILFKISNDPRVTRIGSLLRKYSLDELPQLWNVLRGDMSLVGPRPSIKSEVAQYKIAHLRRLDVMPGITGLWQVEARQNPSFDSYIALDSKYVNTWSIWLDLKILLRTVSAVIGGTGS